MTNTQIDQALARIALISARHATIQREALVGQRLASAFMDATPGHTERLTLEWDDSEVTSVDVRAADPMVTLVGVQ